MKRFRSRRFAMLLILMLMFSMAFQWTATISFAEQEELVPPAEGEGGDVEADFVFQYKVDYHKGGGGGITGSPPDDEYHPWKAEFLIQDNGSLEREGFIFLGWHTDDGGPLNDADLEPGDTFITPHNAVNFFPRWQEIPKTYNVFYDGNGNTEGTVPSDSGEYLEDDIVTVLGAGDMAKLGYSFAGWKLGKEADLLNEGDTFEMGEHDVTLVAQWLANELNPIISIEKLVKEVGVDGDFSHEIDLTKLPTSVEYKITVANDGNVDLVNVQVIDEKLPGSPFWIGNLPALSEPVELALISKSFEYGDEFPFENTAKVEAQYSEDSLGLFCVKPPEPKMITISDEDSAIVNFTEPALSIEKTVRLDSSDADPMDELTIFEMPAAVVYHFHITNEGNVPLHNIYVEDAKLFDGKYFLDKDLMPGESTSFDYGYMVSWLDENNQFINEANACGYLEGMRPSTIIDDDYDLEPICSLQDSATVTYIEPGAPAVMIDKNVNDTSVLSGTDVTYTLMVKNIGDWTLYNLQVNDAELGFSQTIPSLDSGESESFTIETTLSIGDRNDGDNFVNTATVTGNTCDFSQEIGAAVYEKECQIVSDEDSVSVLIRNRRGGGGGGGTTTTTTIVEPEPVPEAVPEIIPEPIPEPEPAPIIIEEVTPLGVPVLPKTGEMSPSLFYGLGGALAALGVMIRRKK